MKAKIISAVVKDGKARQITVNTELTPGIGIHIVGMNDISIKTLLLMTILAMHNEGFWIPRRKICLVFEPEVTDFEGDYFEFPAAVAIIVVSGQATLRDLDRCILTGRLDSDGRLGDLPDPLALAEYARERDMLAVMPRMQALSLPKELIGHTLMIDSLHELIEVLKIK
jgi:magnesium chelatase family protein